MKSRTVERDSQFAAHSVTYKTGYQDLSTVIEERLQWSAIQSADPLMGALAAWSRTTSLLRTGAYDVGLRLLDRVQSQIATADDLATISMRGPLHLRSAILAARAGNTGTVDIHLDEARQISARLGADTDGGWHQLSFGPSNVAIHDVAAAIELGDGPRALGRAENVRLSSAVPAIRAGHHYMDLARAYLWQNRNEQALASLQQVSCLRITTAQANSRTFIGDGDCLRADLVRRAIGRDTWLLRPGPDRTSRVLTRLSPHPVRG